MIIRLKHVKLVIRIVLDAKVKLSVINVRQVLTWSQEPVFNVQDLANLIIYALIVIKGKVFPVIPVSKVQYLNMKPIGFTKVGNGCQMCSI